MINTLIESSNLSIMNDCVNKNNYEKWFNCPVQADDWFNQMSEHKLIRPSCIPTFLYYENHNDSKYMLVILINIVYLHYEAQMDRCRVQT